MKFEVTPELLTELLDRFGEEATIDQFMSSFRYFLEAMIYNIQEEKTNDDTSNS